MESCYIISTYQAGDDFSEPTFLAGNLEDVCNIVETNECDWQETIYNYAIVWKVPATYLMTGTTEIIGVYNVAKDSWIDYELIEDFAEIEDPVLKFENVELTITKKTGPALTVKYKKARQI